MRLGGDKAKNTKVYMGAEEKINTAVETSRTWYSYVDLFFFYPIRGLY